MEEGKRRGWIIVTIIIEDKDNNTRSRHILNSFFINPTVLHEVRQLPSSSLTLTVYHRTKSLKTLSSVLSSLGEGDHRPLYLTYDLPSQISQRMIHIYGKFLLQFRVTLRKMLIFDKELLLRVYGSVVPLVEQWKKVVRHPLPEDITFLSSLDDKWLSSNNPHLSGPSKSLFRYLGNSERSIFSIGFDSVLYSGSLDGKVLVLGDTKKLRPISYAESAKRNVLLTWRRIENTHD